MKQFVTTAAATASLSMAMLPAHADIQYTQETRMPDRPGDKPFSTSVVYKRPGAERTETTYQFGATEQKSVSLTVCAKKEMYTLDPALKLYYATPLATPAAANRPAAKAAAGQKTGTMTMTLVSLRDLGPQKVGQFNAHGYEVVTRMQTSGCMGNSTTTTKQQIFVAPQATLASGSDGCRDMTTAGGSTVGNCKVAMIRKGDWSRYEKITRGLQVRTRIYNGNAVQMETQTTKVSRAKLAGTLFAIPAGFKRVSSQEFQAAQSKAMMERMRTQQNDNE
ncbi:MAG TPA: hypothetical protein VF600_14305 [Abditibacteriaceae bacterium]